MGTCILFVRADGESGRQAAPANPHPGDAWEVAEVRADEAAERLDAWRTDALVLPDAGDGRLDDLAGEAAARGVPVLRRPRGAHGVDALALELAAVLERRTVEQRLAQLERIGGRDFLVEMLDLGLSNLPEQLNDAAAAAAAGDWATVRRRMHSLKSSAGNFGLRAVQELAQAAEGRAAAGDPGAAEAVAAAAAAFARGRPMLETARAGEVA